MASPHLEPASSLSQVVRFNNSYGIQHFRNVQALNSLQFLTATSAGFLRTHLPTRRQYPNQQRYCLNHWPWRIIAQQGLTGLFRALARGVALPASALVPVAALLEDQGE